MKLTKTVKYIIIGLLISILFFGTQFAIIYKYLDFITKIDKAQQSIEYSQQVIIDNLEKQRCFLISQNVEMMNMRVELDNFHSQLREEMKYFLIKDIKE